MNDHEKHLAKMRAEMNDHEKYMTEIQAGHKNHVRQILAKYGVTMPDDRFEELCDRLWEIVLIDDENKK